MQAAMMGNTEAQKRFYANMPGFKTQASKVDPPANPPIKKKSPSVDAIAASNDNSAIDEEEEEEFDRKMLAATLKERL